MFRSIVFILLMMAGVKSFGQSVIPLYQKIPNAIAGPNEEVIDSTSGKTRVSKISIPTLSVYLPPKEKANGTAVIICPGGGYARVVMNKEGSDVAQELNKVGVTAFVLKYRLPDDKTMKNKEIGPLQDAQQAIKLVRQRAAEWNVDTNKVGIMGFSAGGHLASTAATHFKTAVIDNKENISLRPDFQILLYPVISLTDSLAHRGSRENLIGKTPSPEKIRYYSNEFQVTKETPPAFIIHASDDASVKVANSLRFYEALQKNGVPSELHIYTHGGHGFGLNNQTTSDQWLERCKNWMAANGWIK